MSTAAHPSITKPQIRKVWALLRQVSGDSAQVHKVRFVSFFTGGRTKSLRMMHAQEAGQMLDWLDGVATVMQHCCVSALRRHIRVCFSAAGVRDVDAYLLKRGTAKKRLCQMSLPELEATRRQAWAVYHRRMRIGERLLRQHLAGTSVTLSASKKRGRKAS